MACSIAYAQDVKSILTNTSDKYLKSESYQINAQYNLYADRNSNSIIYQQESVFIKNGNAMYFKMAESELVQTNDFTIKISHTEQMILYSKSNQRHSSSSQLPYLDLEHYFASKKLIDKGKYWECVMKDNDTYTIPYNQIILHIEKGTYTILKQIYFFNRPILNQFSNMMLDGDERLEIVTNQFVTVTENIERKFDIKTYLDITDKTLTSSNYTKNYKIIVQ
jgi:hypothetical protein